MSDQEQIDHGSQNPKKSLSKALKMERDERVDRDLEDRQEGRRSKSFPKTILKRKSQTSFEGSDVEDEMIEKSPSKSDKKVKIDDVNLEEHSFAMHHDKDFVDEREK